MISPRTTAAADRRPWLGTLFLLFFLTTSLPILAGAEPLPEVTAGFLRNNPPNQFLDEKTGKPAGFSMEIMEEVARIAGYRVRYLLFDNTPDAIAALAEHRIDLLPGFGSTPERRPAMDFTAPIDAVELRLIIRESNRTIQGVEDLTGKRVAVVTDSLGYFHMRQYGRIQVVPFRSLEEALLSLLSGSTDALVHIAPMVLAVAHKAGLRERIRAVGQPLTEFKRAIAVAKGRPELLGRIDQAVKSLLASPNYETIYRKWYRSPEPYWTARRILIASGGLLALVVLAFAAWYYVSIQRINRELKAALRAAQQASALVQESEARYRTLVESSQDMIWEVDQNSLYTYISPKVADLLGYGPEELIGKSPFDHIPADEASRVGPLLHELAGKRLPFRNVETRHLRKDGTPVILETTAMPIVDADGAFRGYRGMDRDVTERRQAEEALRASEAKYRGLHESMMDALAMTDMEGRILECNRVYLDMLGYAPEEIVRLTYMDVTPEKWLSIEKVIVEDQLFKRGYSEVYEKEYRRKDGTVFPVELRTTLLRDAAGRPVSMWGIVRDITERKRAEQELQGAKELLEKVFASLDAAILVTDPATRRIRACNASVKPVFGYEPGELLGRDTAGLHPTQGDYEEAELRTAAGLDTDGVYRAECQMKRRDGSLFPADATVTEMRGDSRERSGLVVVVRDISKEATLRQERQRLAMAIEQSGEMVLMTDREGITEYVNPAFEKITGYLRPEAIGRSALILKSDQHDPAVYAEAADALRHGRMWQGRLTVTTRDGGLVAVNAAISPVRNLSGEVTHFVAVMNDVTEQLRTEKQLLQAQKMEAIGTLAGGIAHDFNNILGAISGYTEISLSKVPSDSRIRHYLEQIHAATRRAITLVGQILAFSRQHKTERTSVSLIPLIKEASRLLREIIPSTIAIRLDFQATADTVLGDPTEVYQILMNLCTNAYHAMRETGGFLEITLREVEIAEEPRAGRGFSDLPPGPYLELTVRDTGQGIDPMIQPRIFEPFFTTKSVGEGTGLGLSMVHGIVASYGGRITVESRIGQGSTFRVCLPRLAEPLHPATAEAEGWPERGGTGRILLVDDEAMIAAMTKEGLEECGYKVTAVTDSTEALETFRAAPESFDIVLTDRTMPFMTGIDLAARIIEIRPGMPVILCTGFIDAVVEERALATGIRAVLMKPLNLRKLCSLIPVHLTPPSRG